APADGGLAGSTPSTLAAAVGQQRTLFPAARVRLFGLLVGGVLVATIVTGVTWQRRRPPAPIVRPVPAPLVAPVGAAAPPAAVAPPPARIVRWSVYTEPSGATVVRVSDGSVLGATPWQSELPAATGTEELRLRLPGYVERLIRLDRAADA